MPVYQNQTNRKVTIFIKNSIPVRFLPGEHKILSEEGLESKYGRYLRRVDVVLEGKEGQKNQPAPEKGIISEVKQPDPNKELVKEPMDEDVKKGKKVIREAPKKVSEGYSPWKEEQTIASTSKQGKE